MTGPAERDPASLARESLRAILDRYDHDNRVLIDQVYGQLSPTLDDFYDERLAISFPKGRLGPEAADVTPKVVLTRVIPVGPTRVAENVGAPFPIGAVRELVANAARGSEASRAVRELAARLATGEAWLAPRQVGRTQRVIVVAIPEGDDLDAVLASID